MKCMYKEGPKECTNLSTFTCSECQIKVLYCKEHAEAHFTDTTHKYIEILGLNHFKKQINTSINNIFKYTGDIITEIRRNSLTTITHLKQIIKNIKNIDEFTLKSYDAETISFFIEQVRDIDKKMNEILQQSTEKLSIFRKKEFTDQIVNILSSNGTD